VEDATALPADSVSVAGSEVFGLRKGDKGLGNGKEPRHGVDGRVAAVRQADAPGGGGLCRHGPLVGIGGGRVSGSYCLPVLAAVSAELDGKQVDVLRLPRDGVGSGPLPQAAAA